MKRYKLLLFLPILFMMLSCSEDETLSPAYNCLQVEVLGKIRSAGGGLAVKLEHPLPHTIRWQGYEHVAELLNIPVELSAPGSVFYVNARLATEDERGIITADGDESIRLLLYGLDFAHTACEK